MATPPVFTPAGTGRAAVGPVGNSQSTSQSYRPGYTNLPPGMYNAGEGGNNAYMGTVNPNSLVANQLTGLLDQNSPYMQQARLSGMNTANSRGLLNSSMAAGSAQQAAIQAGLPIASQDAATYGTQDLENQKYLNAILQQKMSDATSRYGSDNAAGASMYATDVGARSALQRQRESLAYGGEQAQLDRNFKTFLETMGYQQGLGRDAFQLAGNLLQGSQDFRNEAGIRAMENPFILQNPEAFGGYMDWIGGNYGMDIDSLIDYAFGGGY